jgi:signal transduction histidine kinase
MSAEASPGEGRSRQTRMTEDLLRRRDAILAAVARSAEQLAQPKPWHELVPRVLRTLGEATGVSRVYVFENQRAASGDVLVSQRFEWVAPGVTPQIDVPELQNVPLHEAGFTRWATLMEAGKPVVGDIDQFPASERPLLEMQQILSILVQPIYAGPRWWGFMGFDACEQVQSWEKVEVDALLIAARLLGNALHQQERDTMLRLAQKMEALGRMAGGIAHDFNNVLMILENEVCTLADDLEENGHLTDPRKQSVELLDQALQQATGLTRRLLDFSRRREGPSQVVDLGAHLERSSALLRQAAGSRVQLTVMAFPGSAPVRIDPVQLEQVALNLVVNARDAMPEGGRVEIAVAPAPVSGEVAVADGVSSGEWVLLRVKDNGQGMTPEVRERIFEPFFTTKTPDRGTGLGLSTLYAIVTGAGGRVAVTSAPGHGTEFRVYLPVTTGA